VRWPLRLIRDPQLPRGGCKIVNESTCANGAFAAKSRDVGMVGTMHSTRVGRSKEASCSRIS
jgi:hypothetical protein